MLGVSSGVSAANVAEKTAMDKVAVSRAINNMIKNNLVSRSFADDDKRRSELSLTELGQETYAQIVPLVQSYEKKIVASLDKTDQQALNNILDKLTHFVEEQE